MNWFPFFLKILIFITSLGIHIVSSVNTIRMEAHEFLFLVTLKKLLWRLNDHDLSEKWNLSSSNNS